MEMIGDGTRVNQPHLPECYEFNREKMVPNRCPGLGITLDTKPLRWRALGPADFARTLVHPVLGPMSLDTLLAIYEWHGRHHVAHVTALRQRMGWGTA